MTETLSPAPAGPALPRAHPGADVALVLGLISVVGLFFVLPVLLGPYAWYRGLAVQREIDRDPSRWRGRRHATAGLVLGAVATALLVIGTLGAIAIALMAQVSLGLDTGYGT